MALIGATHLILDLMGCSRAKLSDPAFMKEFLDGIPAKVGMTLMTPCTPERLDAKDHLDSGWSLVTLLCESHISAHCFENIGFCFMDIFSCSSFDTSLLTAIVIEELEAKGYKQRIVDRSYLFELAKANIEAEIVKYDNPEEPKMDETSP